MARETLVSRTTSVRRTVLSDGAVAARDTFRGQDDLPELGLARPEVGRRSHQPEVPHPPEALAVARGDLRPVLLEIRGPRHERAIVVHAERMDILDQIFPLLIWSIRLWASETRPVLTWINLSISN